MGQREGTGCSQEPGLTPGLQSGSGSGAGGHDALAGKTESTIFNKFYFIYIDLFSFGYNYAYFVSCRALFFSPLENELGIGSQLVLTQRQILNVNNFQSPHNTH